MERPLAIEPMWPGSPEAGDAYSLQQPPFHAELHHSLTGDDTLACSHELHCAGLKPPYCCGST